MPFKSEKQRKWMHANNPKMAKKWEKEEKGVKRAAALSFEDTTSTHSGKTCDQAHPKTSHDEWEKNQQVEEAAKRDYKDEYKKFQSSTKSKKYRAELNKYNRQKGTYGNGDKKDASHKGGKIVGFEEQSKNRGRAEKSRLKKENLIKKIVREEYYKILVNEDEQGTYGYEAGTAGNVGSDAEDANIDLYRKAVKALNLWVAEKGRPSQRVWRGGHPKSFESVAKKLYPDEYKYVMAKAWTVPVREIPFYYGQVAGQPKAKSGTGGYKGAETTGKEKGWQGQKGSGIAGKGVK